MSEPPQALVARELGPVRYAACMSRDYAREHRVPTALEELRSVPIVTSAAVGRQLLLAAYLGTSGTR